MTLPKINNYFHPPQRNHPFWNESGWFSIACPEERVSGFAYVNHRPNMGYSIGGIALWDERGSEPYDCVYYDWTLNPMPTEAQMFDFHLENGFAIETVEPLASYRVTYEGGGLGYDGEYVFADLRWTAIAPLRMLDLSEEARGWMGEHYEQIGRMQGQITVRGHNYTIDSYSIRDHSWGPRRPKKTARSSFAWSIDSKDHAFCVWTGQDSAHGDDPVAGTTEQLRHGWYLKDGVVSDFVTAQRVVTERREDGLHHRVSIVAVDQLGRTLEALGDVGPRLNFTGYPEMMISWAGTNWRYDGVSAWGEEHDTIPIQIARRFLRSVRA